MADDSIRPDDRPEADTPPPTPPADASTPAVAPAKPFDAPAPAPAKTGGDFALPSERRQASTSDTPKPSTPSQNEKPDKSSKSSKSYKAPRDPFAIAEKPRRRRWPKILLGVVVVLALLLLLAPKLIPSGQLRSIVATQISKALGGRAVEVDGIGFGWWDGVRLRGLRVAGAAPDAPPLLTLDDAYADAKILPLLSGRVENIQLRVKNLRLRARPADLALLDDPAAPAASTPAPAPDGEWRLDWVVPELNADAPSLTAAFVVKGTLAPGDDDPQAAKTAGGIGFNAEARVLKGDLQNLAFDPDGKASATLRFSGLDLARLDRQLALGVLSAGRLDGPVVAELADGKARVTEAALAVDSLAMAADGPPLPRVKLSSGAVVDLAQGRLTLSATRVAADENDDEWLRLQTEPVDINLADLANGHYLDTALRFEGRLVGEKAVAFLEKQKWIEPPPLRGLRAELPFSGAIRQEAPTPAAPGALALSVAFNPSRPLTAELAEESGAPGALSVDLKGRVVEARLPVTAAGPDAARLSVNHDMVGLSLAFTPAGWPAPAEFVFGRGNAGFAGGRQAIAGDGQIPAVSKAGEALRAEAAANAADRVMVDGLEAELRLPPGNPLTRDAARLALAAGARYDLVGGWLDCAGLTIAEPGQAPLVQVPAFNGVLRSDIDAPAVKAALGGAAGAAPVYAEFSDLQNVRVDLDLPRLESLLRPEMLGGLKELKGRAGVYASLRIWPESVQAAFVAELDGIEAVLPATAPAGATPDASAVADTRLQLPPPAAGARNQVNGFILYDWARGRVALVQQPTTISVGPINFAAKAGEFDPAAGTVEGFVYEGQFNPAVATELLAALGVPAALFAEPVSFRGRLDGDAGRVAWSGQSVVYGALRGADDSPQQFQLYHDVTVGLPTEKDPAPTIAIPESANPQYPSFAALFAGGGASLQLRVPPSSVRLDPAKGYWPEGALQLTASARLPSVAPYARLALRGNPDWQRMDAVLSRHDAAVDFDLEVSVDPDGLRLAPRAGKFSLLRAASGQTAAATVLAATLAATLAAPEGQAAIPTWRFDREGKLLDGQTQLRLNGELEAFWLMANEVVQALPDAVLAGVPAPGPGASEEAAATYRQAAALARSELSTQLASWPMRGSFGAQASLAAAENAPLTLKAIAEMRNVNVWESVRDPATGAAAAPALMFADPRVYTEIALTYDIAANTVTASTAYGGVVGSDPQRQTLVVQLAADQAPFTVKLPAASAPGASAAPAGGGLSLNVRPRIVLTDAAALQRAAPGFLAGPMQLQGSLEASFQANLSGDTLSLADGVLSTSTGFLYSTDATADAMHLQLAAGQTEPARFGGTIDLAPPALPNANPEFAALASINLRDLSLQWPTLWMSMGQRRYQLANGAAKLDLKGGVLRLEQFQVDAVPVDAATAAGAGAAGGGLQPASLRASGSADFTQANPPLDFQLGAVNVPIPELAAGLLPTAAKVENGILNVPAEAGKTLRVSASGLTAEALQRTLRLQDADFSIQNLSVIATLPEGVKTEGVDKLANTLKTISTAGTLANIVKGGGDSGQSREERISGALGSVLGALGNKGTSGAGAAGGQTSASGSLPGGGGDTQSLILKILRFDQNRQRRVVFKSIGGGFVADGQGNIGLDPQKPLLLVGDDDMADLRVHGQITAADPLLQSPIDFTAEISGKLNKLFDYGAILELLIGFTGRETIRDIPTETLIASINEHMEKAAAKRRLSFPIRGTLAKPDIMTGLHHFLMELLEETFKGMATTILKDVGTKALGNKLGTTPTPGATNATGSTTTGTTGATTGSDPLRDALGGLFRR